MSTFLAAVLLTLLAIALLHAVAAVMRAADNNLYDEPESVIEHAERILRIVADDPDPAVISRIRAVVMDEVQARRNLRSQS